jgi:DNA mismatch repair ATPase MutS
MTLVMPILLILIPFFLLKLQGIPITINTYFSVLKDIAKTHFIGKALGTVCTKLDITNIIYLLMICAFFVFQMYQNVVSFFRFYNNIKLINTHLTTMRTYLKYSIHNMDSFNDVNSKYATYSDFCKDLAKHSNVLKELLEKVENITDFSLSISKFNAMGYMLKCYYELYSNPAFDESLRYSFGFEGYMDNLRGAHSHVLQSKINTTSYNTTNLFELKEQYYISHMNSEHVKNDCTIDNNMIITGVNASGKTTMLKSITINILFSQQIGYGFYKKCKLHPYTHIHSYLNIPDTSGRDSLFQAESRRCKEMIDIIGECDNTEVKSRHFCILDELYSGTNPTDAIKASYAFLQYLCKYSNVKFILTTHYTDVCQKLEDSSAITNYRMDVKQEDDGKLNFNYKLKPGICTIQGAIEILKAMDYPKDIIETIQKYDNVDTKIHPILESNDECMP